MDTIAASALRPYLERVAAGGEGVVYRISSDPQSVYKEYKPEQRRQINADSLRELIDTPASWPAADRTRLMARTTWPRKAVVDQTGLCGFLMSAIDDRYYVRYGLRANPKRVLCDWNQLTYQSGAPLAAHLVSEVPKLTAEMVVHLLHDLVLTVDALHRHGVIIGDMSGKNLIWRGNPFEVLVIDCDSFRMNGQVGVCVHKETPGWVDPALQGRPTSTESDVFKLGVAAYRALYRDPNSVVTPSLLKSRPDLGLPRDLSNLIAGSLSDSARPTSADWAAAFAMLFKYGGRRVLPVPVKPVAPAAPAPERVRPRLPAQGQPG